MSNDKMKNIAWSYIPTVFISSTPAFNCFESIYEQSQITNKLQVDIGYVLDMQCSNTIRGTLYLSAEKRKAPEHVVRGQQSSTSAET